MVKTEGDVVASKKEAEQAGQQLIKEDYNTLVGGRNLHQADRLPEAAGFQKQLNMKNDQISELQKCGRSRTRRRQGITWL